MNKYKYGVILSHMMNCTQFLAVYMISVNDMQTIIILNTGHHFKSR